jgi:Asp/Glu/hydantoin racemase
LEGEIHMANSNLGGMVLGVIHAGTWVAATGMRYAKEIIPEVTVLHITDDTIQWAFTRAMNDQGVAQEHIPRFNYYRVATYCRFLQEAGAHAILFGCSTMNRSVEYARPLVDLPIIAIDRPMEYARPLVDLPIIAIDRPMMDTAVRVGVRIGLLATLDTTVPSSLRQLRNAAAAVGREIDVVQIFVGDAFRALRSGDQATHDRLLLEAIETHQDQVDVIVMAQLSMAALEPQIEEAHFTIPVLNSGREGFTCAREVLQSLQRDPAEPQGI